MTINLEIEKLKQINIDYEVRKEDTIAEIETLNTDIKALEALYVEQTQADNELASDTFSELETAKSELRQKEAILEALTQNKVDSSNLEAQADIVLDALDIELTEISNKRTIAIDEYNTIVDTLAEKAREISIIQRDSLKASRQVREVSTVYPGIGEKRSDFYMKTGKGYAAKPVSARYTHSPKMIVGQMLSKAISDVIPNPSTW